MQNIINFFGTEVSKKRKVKLQRSKPGHINMKFGTNDIKPIFFSVSTVYSMRKNTVKFENISEMELR